ncbi:hypothetical protein FQA39_LY14333 [Lamprigera yunnana]|nr:hypothetical protein FQA39_LY14333 [Lamprigera yunnana]
MYNIGKRPKGVMPGTKSFFLGLFGETAVDFDFGQPEIPQKTKIIEENSIINIPQSELEKDTHSLLKKFEHLKLSGTKSSDKFNELQWPVYLLDGIGSVSVIMINLSDKIVPKVKGPLPMCPSSNQNYLNEACAILCQPCSPPIICIATSNGTIMHSIVLPYDEKHDKLKNMRTKTKNFDAPDRAMYVFETLELELGLATTENLSNYCCPVFLHPNDSHAGEYFAIHEAGVHYITVPAIDTLNEILNGPEDESLMEQLVTQPSSAEYLLCTKTASSNKINPVIGFSLYYDPTSTIMLLAKGQVISTLLLSFASLPNIDDFLPENLTDMNTPLKKMLSEPFDLQIYKILKQASSQPILKLSDSGSNSQQECYELLQRASKALREEHFKFHDKAYEEIKKRIKVLQMLKNYQINELIKLGKEKQSLQDKAEYLAEKYEDVADKQNGLRKRCEKLLIMVAQKKKDPTEAELKFSSTLKEAQQKIKLFNLAMDRLKNQSSYQEVQMENWHKDQIKKDTGLASIQSNTIKTNLRDMTNQITDMINEVIEYKKQLGLN